MSSVSSLSNVFVESKMNRLFFINHSASANDIARPASLLLRAGFCLNAVNLGSDYESFFCGRTESFSFIKKIRIISHEQLNIRIIFDRARSHNLAPPRQGSFNFVAVDLGPGLWLYIIFYSTSPLPFPAPSLSVQKRLHRQPTSWIRIIHNSAHQSLIWFSTICFG